MRYAKTLGAVAAALAAMMAFAGGAWGTSLTQAPPYTGTVKAESGGAVKIDGTVVLTCQKSAFEWNVETHGASVTTRGPVTKFTLEECGSNTITVVQRGSFELHTTSGGNGTMTWSGAEITTLTHNVLGTVHCIRETDETHIGTLTGSAATGGTATLDIGSSHIPEFATDITCGEDDAQLTGDYKFTSPDYLYID